MAEFLIWCQQNDVHDEMGRPVISSQIPSFANGKSTHLLAASRAVLEERSGGQELLKVPQRSPDGVRHDAQHALQVRLRRRGCGVGDY